MPLYEKLFEFFSFWSPKKRISYAINGVFMGLGAPLGWLLVDILFCRPPGESILTFVAQEITRSSQQMLLFTYMTLATSLVLSVTGFLVGQVLDWNREKVDQLHEVHETINAQKTAFEERFLRLHEDMTSLYRIGADIQRSMRAEQVLELLAEGAHGFLNFDRVNIFMVTEDKTHLECREFGASARKSNDLTVPLSESAGLLARTIKENKAICVQDMAMMPQEWRLSPPLSHRPELRSSAFACIPLRERGEAIGLIAVDNKESRREIREEQVATLQVLADQGSVSITNIALFRGIQKLHRELERNFIELLDRKAGFSELAKELTEQSRMISGAIEQVAANADALSQTVTETTVSSQEMSASLNQTASAVKNLFGEARRTLDSAERISYSIQQVETSVAESNVLSLQVKEEAQGGVTLVHDSLQGVME
ncbi:MAG: GAF domain-containing protein, partial [bacterium]|nr:GAF domain-containing protein [bacterium]